MNYTKKFLVSKNILLTNYRGYFETNGQRFSNRNNYQKELMREIRKK